MPWLQHPPIVEAVIDVRVPAGESEVGRLGELQVQLAGEYPKVYRGSQQTLQVEGGPSERSISHTETLQGFAFATNDDDRIVQARLDGFTYNWVGGYETWEKLSDEARRAYTLYDEVAKPALIQQVGLRYINSLAVPRDASFEEYSRMRTEVPETLPVPPVGLLTRVALRFDDHIIANVNSLFEPSDTGTMSWQLDIDVMDADPIEASSVDTIWAKLVRLREIKNQVFFEIVTDKALESYR